MALQGRSKASDFLTNFRFHVEVLTANDNYDDLESRITNSVISAGFNACSAPSVSEDAIEYREGYFIYTQKYPGIAKVNDITLSRGVALTDGTMYQWIKDVVEGNAEYRAQVNIYHFHRDAKNPTDFTNTNSVMMPNPSAGGFALYSCANAFPTEYKTSGDLDATSSEISIQELTMAIESFNVILDQANPP
jgi:phage tail-like protein